MSAHRRAPDRPPRAVADAAARGQLGRLVMAQQGGNPPGNVIFVLVGAGVLLGFALLWGWLGATTGVRVLHSIGLLCLALAVVAVVLACAAPVAGFTATHLYENGLVHTRNRRVQAVAWSEVDEMLIRRTDGSAAAGTVLAYSLITRDGRRVPVEALSRAGDNALAARLEEIVRSLGRPVVDSGPYTGRLRP